MSNNTSSNSNSGIPVIFLGASTFAFFDMPEVASTAESLVGAAGVGVVSSVGGNIGMFVGGGLSALFGALVAPSYSKDAGAAIGGVAGIFGGLAVGVYYGYQISKNIVDGFYDKDIKQEVITSSPQEQSSLITPKGEFLINKGNSIAIIPA